MRETYGVHMQHLIGPVLKKYILRISKKNHNGKLGRSRCRGISRIVWDGVCAMTLNIMDKVQLREMIG